MKAKETVFKVCVKFSTNLVISAKKPCDLSVSSLSIFRVAHFFILSFLSLLLLPEPPWGLHEVISLKILVSTPHESLVWSWVWWVIHAIPALGELRQEDGGFEDSLGYKLDSYLKMGVEVADLHLGSGNSCIGFVGGGCLGRYRDHQQFGWPPSSLVKNVLRKILN